MLARSMMTNSKDHDQRPKRMPLTRRVGGGVEPGVTASPQTWWHQSPAVNNYYINRMECARCSD